MLFEWKQPQNNSFGTGIKPSVRKHDKSSKATVEKRMIFISKILFIIAFIGACVITDVSFKIFSNKEDFSRSLVCSTGILKSGLRVSRILCEVDTSLKDQPFRDAFSPSSEVRRADYETDRPGGTSNIAFVVTIPSCPEDLSHTSADDDPGAAFYDAAAVLRDSICNNTAQNPDSSSSYNSTMYAIIHPDAITCAGPTSSASRRLSSSDADRSLSQFNYDRISVLEELGFWVIIWREPVSF